MRKKMNDNIKTSVFILFFGIICFVTGATVSGFIGNAKAQKSYIELEGHLDEERELHNKFRIILGKSEGRNREFQELISQRERIIEERERRISEMARSLSQREARDNELDGIIKGLREEQESERAIFEEIEILLDS